MKLEKVSPTIKFKITAAMLGVSLTFLQCKYPWFYRRYFSSSSLNERPAMYYRRGLSLCNNSLPHLCLNPVDDTSAIEDTNSNVPVLWFLYFFYLSVPLSICLSEHPSQLVFGWITPPFLDQFNSIFSQYYKSLDLLILFKLQWIAIKTIFLEEALAKKN